MGTTLAGRDDLVRALGRHDEARLLWDAAAFEVVARDGEAVTDALLADLAGIIIPALERAPDEVREATTAAHRGTGRSSAGCQAAVAAVAEAPARSGNPSPLAGHLRA